MNTEYNITQILRKINSSVWAQPYNESVLNFYQLNAADHIPIRYGLYSYNLNRFIAVDGLDLWNIVTAAKILSSKLALTLTVFKTPPPNDFTNDTCLLWEVENKNSFLALKQTPGLCTIDGADIIKTGFPDDHLQNINEIVKDQEYCYLVIKSTLAAQLAQAMCDAHPRINNIDFSLYLSFLNTNKFSTLNFFKNSDKTPWPNGFSHHIFSVMYRAQNIDEVVQDFKKLSENNCDEETFIYKKPYFKYFYKFLSRSPIANS
jgi:hypothetical protein